MAQLRAIVNHRSKRPSSFYFGLSFIMASGKIHFIGVKHKRCTGRNLKYKRHWGEIKLNWKVNIIGNL